MADTFITKIQIDKVRHLENLTIELSDTERKHLILTGKNGSGKTSVLEDMNQILDLSVRGNLTSWVTWHDEQRNANYVTLRAINTNTIRIWLSNPESDIYTVQDTFFKGKFIVAYFDAKRLSNMITPKGPQKVGLKPMYTPKESAYKDFIQYIVNLKAERSFAKDDNDLASSQKIDAWFDRFLQRIRKLFQSPELELEFDRKEYNFFLKEKGKLPYTFNQLSDGYSALFMIVSEIIMRMEGQNSIAYDKAGIVLIDEIETHLHVSLQKEIMPFLINFFPNIQFIVTTHSPFVITSLSNAVVYDLENQESLENLSAYSYDGIVEYYFDAQKYSDQAKTNFDEYKTLAEKKERTESEDKRLAELITYFRQTPILGSPEIMNAFFASELERRSSVNG